MKKRRIVIYTDEDGTISTTFSDGAHGEGYQRFFNANAVTETSRLTRFYPGFGGSNRLDFFSPYGVSMSLLFFSSVNSSRTGHKSDAWRLRVSKSLTQGMWHQSLDHSARCCYDGLALYSFKVIDLAG